MHSSSEVVNTLAIGVDMLFISGRDLGQALHVELPLAGQGAGLDADGLDPGGQDCDQSEPKPPELGQPKHRHPFTAVVYRLRLGNKLRNMDCVDGFGQGYFLPFSIAAHDNLHIVFNWRSSSLLPLCGRGSRRS